jgi:hypothetical protein
VLINNYFEFHQDKNIPNFIVLKIKNMKKVILFSALCLLSAAGAYAQKAKWEDLSKEEKMMKLQGFREANQKYLKDSLGMNQDQLTDIDNVNVCFLTTMERIKRYGKDQGNMKKYAEAVAAARSLQLDAIMGPEKRKKFAEYVEAKLKSAM